ncbi:uncharacterized protein METZ01_LOCUS92018 [marine metagenome]|uniref:Uncharacterized protein n=1 Tax=marine metagenome TaxID=408172 RepID=A0A381VG21_9ZZZZ
MKEDTKALRKRIKSLEQQLALLEDDLYRQKRQKRMKKTGMTLEEILEEEALISKAVNEAMDEVEKQLEDEEDESPEISEIEIKRLERDLQYLLNNDE